MKCQVSIALCFLLQLGVAVLTENAAQAYASHAATAQPSSESTITNDTLHARSWGGAPRYRRGGGTR